MKFVRVVVQECKPGTVEWLTRKVDETLVPRLRSMPGFISYQVAKVDDRNLLVITTYETREGLDEVERLGAEWRRTVGKDAVVSAIPHFGEIILDRSGAAYEEQQPSL